MSRPIPRLFHQIWVGSPLPAQHAKWADQWRGMHPWGYVLWDEQRIRERTWELQDLMELAPHFAPRFQGQFVADLLRLEILWKWGGVYLDTDMEPLQPIGPLLAGVEAFAAWEQEPNTGQPEHGWINTAIMGCTPLHPWLRRLVRNVREHVHDQHRQGCRRPNKLTGPQYVTPHTLEYNTQARNGEALRGPITIFPKQYFYPYLYSELERGREEFPGSYAVHHWNNKRRERRKPL